MLPMKVNKMLYYHHQLYRPSVLMATCLITYDCTLSLAVPQTQTQSHSLANNYQCGIFCITE